MDNYYAVDNHNKYRASDPRSREYLFEVEGKTVLVTKYMPRQKSKSKRVPITQARLMYRQLMDLNFQKVDLNIPF